MGKTINGGTTWALTSTFDDYLEQTPDICFTSATTGYLRMNGLISKTIDGGKSWSVHPWKIENTSGQAYMSEIKFLDQNVGYAYGSLEWNTGSAGWDAKALLLFKTRDAGASWTVQYLGVVPLLSSIHCLNSGDCHAVGENGTIVKFSLR